MTIRRFEELEICQKARELCKKIRLDADSTPLSKDFGLRLYFLYYSKGSLGETRSQVHRIYDSDYITEEKYTELIKDCLNLSGQIKGFINYLDNSAYPGRKKK